ncbi:MAG: hypothetical protein JWO82_85 [Akkermansiaceae bacterium]|nr:hypothetical protein [Akkermansiaceae bacterium]
MKTPEQQRQQQELTARAGKLLAEVSPDTPPFIDSLDPDESRLLAIGVIEEGLFSSTLVWILQSLGGRYPDEALELFEDLEDWLHDLGEFKGALISMLMMVAQTEPDLAVDTFLGKLADIRDLGEEEGDSLKCSMIRAVALGDRQKALSLVGKMEFETGKYRKFAERDLS